MQTACFRAANTECFKVKVYKYIHKKIKKNGFFNSKYSSYATFELQHPLKHVIGFTVVRTFVDLLALIYEQKRLRYITNAVSVSLADDVAQAKKIFCSCEQLIKVG